MRSSEKTRSISIVACVGCRAIERDVKAAINENTLRRATVSNTRVRQGPTVGGSETIFRWPTTKTHFVVISTVTILYVPSACACRFRPCGSLGRHRLQPRKSKQHEGVTWSVRWLQFRTASLGPYHIASKETLCLPTLLGHHRCIGISVLCALCVFCRNTMAL